MEAPFHSMQRRPARFVALLLSGLLLLVAGCDSGSDDESDRSSVEGVWESEEVAPVDEALIAQLDLQQDGSDVSGTLRVEFTNEGQIDEFDILEGTYDPPDLDLTIESDADEADSQPLSCVVQQSGETMECDFGGEDVTLTRQ